MEGEIRMPPAPLLDGTGGILIKLASLKNEFQRKLYLARTSGSAGDLPCPRIGDRVAGGIEARKDTRCRGAEHRVIENVEEFRPEFRIHFFRNLCCLLHSGIQLDDSGRID